MDITKIVITGGPCAGKTTAMNWIQHAFTERGYDVLFVPETATELITGGVAPWTCRTNSDYQHCHMRFQLEKEKVFEQAARVMKKDKVLIVCDRAALDNKVYMDEETFRSVLQSVHASEVELRDQYDAVFHLVTAAKGAEEFYTTANNTARTETVEEAAAMDDKFIAAWTGHPHLRVIDNSTDFEDKMKRLIAEIASFLGEPGPFEIERKFLIEYPDIEMLDSLPNCEKVEIIQTYLKVNEMEEVRVRQRGSQGHYIYYQTRKRRVSEYKRIELERRISKDEYLNLIMNADTSLGRIRKDRYCLTYNNQSFQIDVYPFWKDRAIAEIELQHVDHQRSDGRSGVPERVAGKAQAGVSIKSNIDEPGGSDVMSFDHDTMSEPPYFFAKKLKLNCISKFELSFPCQNSCRTKKERRKHRCKPAWQQHRTGFITDTSGSTRSHGRI